MAGSPPSAAVAPPPPPDPLQAIEAQLKTLAGTPTWEDAVDLMRQDGPRGFRVDIETDSTIAANQAEEQAAITQLLGGITQFMGGIAPAVEQGYMTVDTAKALILAAVRRFKLGKVVEDTIAQMGQGQSAAPKPPAPQVLENQYKMANLAFQEKQAQMDYDTKMRQMALDERGMGLKEQEQGMRSQAEDAKTALEHHAKTRQTDLDAMMAAHNAQMDQSRQHLEEFKAVSGHLQGLLQHVREMHKMATDQQPEVTVVAARPTA